MGAGRICSSGAMSAKRGGALDVEDAAVDKELAAKLVVPGEDQLARAILGEGEHRPGDGAADRGGASGHDPEVGTAAEGENVHVDPRVVPENQTGQVVAVIHREGNVGALQDRPVLQDEGVDGAVVGEGVDPGGKANVARRGGQVDVGHINVVREADDAKPISHAGVGRLVDPARGVPNRGGGRNAIDHDGGTAGGIDDSDPVRASSGQLRAETDKADDPLTVETQGVHDQMD